MIEVAARKDAIEREAGYVTDSTKPSHFFREHVKAPCYPLLGTSSGVAFGGAEDTVSTACPAFL